MPRLTRLAPLALLSALHCGGEATGAQPAVPTDAATCPSAASLCGSVCVDLSKDPAHCGACSHACEPGQVCSNGTCSMVCSGGTTRCGDLCVNTKLDPSHCGACDHACKTGEVCSAGTCSLTCSGGTTRCGDRCVELQTDPTNCGKCSSTCKSPEQCVAGQCALVCPPGQTKCDDQCVNLLEDSLHCGTCTTACPQGQVCAVGNCAFECPLGLVACDGACIDPLVSPNHCGATGDCAGPNAGESCGAGMACNAGACTLSCQPGLTDCSGMCANLQTDPANCGQCALACSTGQVCTQGLCELVCVPPLTKCGAVCVDPQSDPGNCGACGNVCDFANGKAACLSGACALVGCTAGHGDCNHDQVDGCENTLGSDSHCGQCDHACDPASAFCRSQACVACAGPPAAVDQLQLSANSGALVMAEQYVEQTFTVGTSGILAGIEVRLCRESYIYLNTGISLTLLDAGTLAPLASVMIPSSAVSMGCAIGNLGPGPVPGPHYFDLSYTCLHVAAGQELRMRFDVVDPVTSKCVNYQCDVPSAPYCTGDLDCMNFGFRLYYRNKNPYPLGMVYHNGTPNPDSDIAFKTYMR
ncbi:MAG: hypothetical protein HY898_14690 [Deltaproteobacteria bacterium]|nr:hypothetical protein [Deltaproteobacteria bacterium]